MFKPCDAGEHRGFFLIHGWKVQQRSGSQRRLGNILKLPPCFGCKTVMTLFTRLFARSTWLTANHGFELMTSRFRGFICFTHQVGTEHEEADEVNVGQIASTCELLSWLDFRFRVTASAGQGGQHDLLPLLPGGTSTPRQRQAHVFNDTHTVTNQTWEQKSCDNRTS